MIPIYESDRIAGYDDWLANRKTSGHDTKDDDRYNILYSSSRSIISDASRNGNPILAGYEQDYQCDGCKYASEHIVTNPDDDLDRIVCYAKKCPFNIWSKYRDRYGNEYIHLDVTDEDIPL